MNVFTEGRIPVLDDTGKVEKWLAEGRGVNVWQVIDLGSPRVGQHVFTPGDQPDKPHWSLEWVSKTNDHNAFIFYQRVRIIKEYMSSVQGHRAAEKFLNNQPDETRDAPIGTVYVTHSIEEHCFATEARVALTDGYSRPLKTNYRWCVVEWVAIDRKEAEIGT